MGTVHRLSTAREEVTTAEAVAAFLATLAHPESRGTQRTYAQTLRPFVQHFGESAAVGQLDPAAVAEWFTDRYGPRSPARWNGALNAIRSAAKYWADQGWITADLTGELRRRKATTDRSRALSRDEVERLLAREDISLRDRVLWRMAYETAARSGELLRLDVEDLDLPNRRARVRRKGGATDTIAWMTGTARLLPRLLKGRTRGPLFLTERRARVALAPCDLDPESGRARLTYGQAESIFKAASGGKTLHTLRHSALTHAAEDGMSAPMLMTKSGHTSVRSLARYARPSIEALQRFEAERDPARRR